MNQVLAHYGKETIRVYQAYGDLIGDEIVAFGKLGSSFSLNRMTWIKPSFLWMMYRCGWATKEGQTRVFAIDMKREGFDIIVSNAVLSSFNDAVHISYENWKKQMESSSVRCQWDPDKNIYGANMERRAIQLGLKGSYIRDYRDLWIVKMEEITDYVHNIHEKVRTGDTILDLPEEKVYPMSKNMIHVIQ
jgi:hypothetical protein